MKSIVICGSRRYKKEINEFADGLEKLGVKVYRPYLHLATHEEWNNLRDDQKVYICGGLTYGHFEKIQKADVVFVYNKDEYSGVSTTLELGYAAALHKPIIALMKDNQEGCRDILFENYATTPEELVKLINY